MAYKKSILMLLDNHFTHDARVLKEAVSLVNAKYDVVVACYWDEGLPKEEVINGVRVERILFTSRKYRKNIIYKIFLFLSYTFKIFKRRKSYDFIHSHDLVMLSIGVFVRWFEKGRVRIIYDSHEYQIERNGQAHWKKPILKKLEYFLMKYADEIITVSNSIADEYARVYGIKKPHVILNVPRYAEEKENNVFREKFDIHKEQEIYLYQGAFNNGRNILKILDTFKSLSDSKKVIVFLGYGPLEGGG